MESPNILWPLLHVPLCTIHTRANASIHSSYDALVADPNIETICNPLPNSLHAVWSRRAAEAGKAVLCEKPLTIDTNEAKQSIDDCSAAGQPLMEAFMYRFHPQHKRVRELIDAARPSSF